MMQQLPEGRVAFETAGRRIPSRGLTGSLYQQSSPTRICHVGVMSEDGATIAVPHSHDGPEVYLVEHVTLLDFPSQWRNMGACSGCQRALAAVPS